MSDLLDQEKSTALTPSKKKKSFFKKKYITSSLCLCLVGVGGVQGYQLFFKEEPLVIVSGTVGFGQLGTTITGSGSTTSAETQSVVAASNAEVLSVHVTAGETIEAGQLLYIQDDSAIDTSIETIQTQIDTYNETISGYQDVISDYNSTISGYNEDIADYRQDMADAVVYAPFDGKVTDITVSIHDNVSNSGKLCQLTSSNSLDVVLYFSYAYEDEIFVGQDATVSIPAQMLSLDGKVTKISKVEYITTEGTRCFAVTISTNNPGSLTAGTAVSATIGEMYPVEAGQLSNAQETSVNAPMAGAVEQIFVDNYQNVTAGQMLFSMNTDSIQDQIDNINDNITSVKEKISEQYEKIADVNEKIAELRSDIADLNQERADFEVYSEISGRVITVNVREGMNANTNTSAVVIYNMDSMEITANIDELDIEHVTMGMDVKLTYSTASSTQNYVGYVSSMSYEATNSNGVAYFPIVITVDSEGALSSGVNVSYSISVGDTGEGFLVPVAALKQSDEGTCVYIEGTSTDGLELPEGEVPEGYYAKLIEIDSSNTSFALVKEGLEEGMTVFTRYQATAPSNGDTTSNVGMEEGATMDMDAMMAMREEMQSAGGMSGMTERPNSTGTTGGGPSGRG